MKTLKEYENYNKMNLDEPSQIKNGPAFKKAIKIIMDKVSDDTEMFPYNAIQMETHCRSVRKTFKHLQRCKSSTAMGGDQLEEI